MPFWILIQMTVRDGWLGAYSEIPEKYRTRTIPINHSMDKVFSSRFLLLLLAEIWFRVNHVPVIYKPCTVDTGPAWTRELLGFVWVAKYWQLLVLFLNSFSTAFVRQFLIFDLREKIPITGEVFFTSPHQSWIEWEKDSKAAITITQVIANQTLVKWRINNSWWIPKRQKMSAEKMLLPAWKETFMQI